VVSSLISKTKPNESGGIMSKSEKNKLIRLIAGLAFFILAVMVTQM